MSSNTTTSGSTISTITGATASEAGGRGGGRQGRSGGRGGRGRGGRSVGRSATTRTTRAVFKGATEEMQGNVFECYDEQADRRQYVKTMESLEIYAKKNFKFYEDVKPLFAVTMIAPNVPLPEEPGVETTEMECIRTTMLTGNMAALFAVIWGQCSESMRAKIKATRGYNERSEANDCYWVLKQIKSVTLQFDEKRNGYIALLDATANFVNLRQAQTQSVGDYVDALRGLVDTIEYHGGSVVGNYELVPLIAEDGTMRSVAERYSIAREKTMACTLLRGADTDRVGTLIAHLANQFANGMNEHPQTFKAAHSLLESYSSPSNTNRNRQRGQQAGTATVAAIAPAPAAVSDAVTFAQRGTVAGSDGVTYEGITCYTCRSTGHYSEQCPQNAATLAGTMLTQHAYMLAQSNDHGIDANWILLDSQSTISVFRNASMLSNIRRSPQTLRTLTNGGHQDSDMIGDFPNLGPVWYDKDSIANILSFADVR
jgi:hypothetical protein